MEDAHVTETDVLGRPDSAVFGVFDGHGGAEVARFCERHLMGVLAADADFKSQAPPTIGCSLVRCFGYAAKYTPQKKHWCLYLE